MNEYGKRVGKKMEEYMGNPDSIDQEVHDLKEATEGVQVRGALAASVSKSFTKSKWAEEKAIEQTERVDTLIKENPQPSEVVDARGNFPILRDRLNSVDSQLAQVDNKLELNPNAEFPLNIPCSTQSDNLVWDQTTHPDVIVFANEWNGYRYWMVHTPYPYTNDFYENPEIVVSNDGVKWDVPEGLINPIDFVTEEQSENGEHLSDGCLVYNTDKNELECWYRWRNKNTEEERIYRKTSSDGVNWSEREIVYSANILSMSPTVLYENGVYKMYLVESDGGYFIRYMECNHNEIGNWKNKQTIPFEVANGERKPNIWHIHILKEHNNLYHLTMAERSGSIYYAHSTTGKEFLNAVELIKPSEDRGAWDNRHLYRGCLVKDESLYRLYYGGAGGRPKRWRIGLSEGESPYTLAGSRNVENNAYRYIDRVKGADAIFTRSQTTNLYVRSDEYNPKAQIRVADRGRAGFRVKVADNQDTAEFRSENDSGLGNIRANQVHASEVKNVGSRTYLMGEFELRTDSGKKPYLRFLDPGVYGAGIKVTDVNTLEIIADNREDSGHLKAATLWLTGDTAIVKTGAMRYNSAIRKFQGLANGYWYNLNNYQPNPPSSSTSGGTTGDYALDDDYVYFCVSPNNWIRIAKDPNW